MKRVLFLITCLSLLPLQKVHAGNSAAAGVLGGVAGFALGSTIASAANRPKYYAQPVEVREVHYTSVPARTTVVSNGSEVRRLQRELNAALTENRELSDELGIERRKNRELQRELDLCLDQIEDLQLQLKRKDEIQKKQREARKNVVLQRRAEQTSADFDEVK